MAGLRGQLAAALFKISRQGQRPFLPLRGQYFRKLDLKHGIRREQCAGQRRGRAYIRFMVADRPGALAEITAAVVGVVIIAVLVPLYDLTGAIN